MNRIFVIVGVVLLFILGVSSCKIADSAEVALVVNQIGNDKGVPNIEMASGLIMYFPQHKMFICIRHRFNIRCGPHR